MSAFEHAVLDWLRSHTDGDLASYLATCRVAGREHTGVGLYLELENHTRVRPPAQNAPVSGPYFTSPEIKHGGGVLLFLKEQYPVTVEVYTYDSPFPVDGPHDFTLHDSPPPTT